MSFNDLWPVLVASAGAVAAWGLLAFVLARSLHRNNIVPPRLYQALVSRRRAGPATDAPGRS
ncbi:MAG TPA: hypothetical protein VG268_18010 [Streptosporangiaceae bacterium]|nr:hypothetical protein [Streptosporangiaceae bacterium]